MDILQNLNDAGCPMELTKLLMDHCKHGRIREALSLLQEHRERLLEEVHEAERKINNLDYLIYQLEGRLI